MEYVASLCICQVVRTLILLFLLLFLKIKKNTLKKYGAVSHKTSKEMTQNLSKITGCDLSITTTGISGPTGDSKNKSIGLVDIGIK